MTKVKMPTTVSHKVQRARLLGELQSGVRLATNARRDVARSIYRLKNNGCSVGEIRTVMRDAGFACDVAVVEDLADEGAALAAY